MSREGGPVGVWDASGHAARPQGGLQQAAAARPQRLGTEVHGHGVRAACPCLRRALLSAAAEHVRLRAEGGAFKPHESENTVLFHFPVGGWPAVPVCAGLRGHGGEDSSSSCPQGAHRLPERDQRTGHREGEGQGS